MLARVSCGCGADFPLFSFPIMGTLGGPTGSVSAPVPERARACPECGTAVDE